MRLYAPFIQNGDSKNLFVLRNFVPHSLASLHFHFDSPLYTIIMLRKGALRAFSVTSPPGNPAYAKHANVIRAQTDAVRRAQAMIDDLKAKAVANAVNSIMIPSAEEKAAREKALHKKNVQLASALGLFALGSYGLAIYMMRQDDFSDIDVNEVKHRVEVKRAAQKETLENLQKS